MSGDKRIAKKIRDLDGFTGDAALFRLSHPVEFEKGSTEFVVVSATNAMFSGPETYIFPANPEGKIICWEELEGSSRGDLDQEAALERAGFSVSKN